MQPIQSPCINVCVLDARTQSCVGCGRTLGEIEGWIGFNHEERAAISAELPGRRARFDAQRAAALQTAQAWPRTQCDQCGSEFTCGATDCSTPCWCASYPPVMPVEGASCLCPSCLAAGIAARAALQGSSGSSEAA